MRGAAVAGIVLALAACSDPPPPPPSLTPDQVSEVELLLSTAQIEARQHEDAVRAAVTATTATPGTDPCPVVVPGLAALPPVGPDVLSTTQVVAARAYLRYLGPESAAIADLPGPAMQSVDALSIWRGRLSGPVYSGTPEQLLAEAHAEIHPTLPAQELVLVARAVTLPSTNGDGTFAPGALVGELYLLDGAQQIQCVAHVSAASGSMVRSHDDVADGALILDLVARGVLGGYAQLRAAVVGRPPGLEDLAPFS